MDNDHLSRLLLTASLRYRENDTELAEVLTKSILDVNPNNELARHLLAKIYISRKEYYKALRIIDQLLAEKESFQLLMDRGEILLNIGEYNAAKTAFSRALELVPDDPFALHYLSYTYYLMNDYDNAVNLLEKAIKNERYSVNTFILLGDAYYGMNNYDSALDAYDKALQLNKHPLIMCKKAKILLLLDNVEEALKILKEAILIDNYFALSWYLYGYCLSKLERNDEYKNALEIAKKYDKDGKFEKEYYNFLADLIIKPRKRKDVDKNEIILAIDADKESFIKKGSLEKRISK